MTFTLASSRLLAFYPNSKGLCYALLERGLRTIDWGIETGRQRKQATVLHHATSLLAMCGPSSIILPSRMDVEKRSRRLQEVANSIEHMSIDGDLGVHGYARADSKIAFGKVGSNSEDVIAAGIARLLPELELHLTPARKLWMSEDYRMGLFDAVAVVLTHDRDGVMLSRFDSLDN